LNWKKKERLKQINEESKNNKYDNRLLFFTYFNDVNKYSDFNEWKPFYEEKVKKNRFFQSNRNIPKSTWSDGKVKEEEKISEKKEEGKTAKNEPTKNGDIETKKEDEKKNSRI